MSNKWPETVDEVVDDLLSKLSEKEKKDIEETSKNDLIVLHFGLGLTIRNIYGLWDGNKKLIESACGVFGHPDDASGIIIESLWLKLQNSGNQ